MTRVKIEDHEPDACDKFNDITETGALFYVCPHSPAFYDYATPDRAMADELAKPLPNGLKRATVYTQLEVSAWRESQKAARA